MSEQKPPSIAPAGKKATGRTTPPPAASEAVAPDAGKSSGPATFTPKETIGVTPPSAKKDAAAATPAGPSPTGTSSTGTSPGAPAAVPAPAPALAPATAPRPAPRPAVQTSDDDGAPRRVRLAIARVDPWSVMKLSFLLAVAAGIMLVVAAAVVWQTLDGLSVFTQINDMIVTLGGDDKYSILEAVSFRRTISLATVLGVVDIVLLTALATLGAFLYNIVAALVGGLHLTLTDD